MDPAFCMMRSHSMVSILFEKKLFFFRKGLGVATYLEKNLKENKIRNKTLSVTLSLENQSCVRESNYLLERYDKRL